MADFRENMCRTFFFRGNVIYFVKTFQQTVIFRLFYRKCKCFVGFFSDDAKLKFSGKQHFANFSPH